MNPTDKEDRLNNLLTNAIKEQTKVLIIPSIIIITLIVVIILIWLFAKKHE